MEVKDLRKGNIVKFDDGSEDIVSVDFIFREDEMWFIQWDKISGSGSFASGNSLFVDFEPITLTPDMLAKCPQWGMWGDGTWTDGGCDYQYDFKTKIFATHNEVDGSGWQLRKIEFVHDFQNLYHSLTGTELSIQLNEKTGSDPALLQKNKMQES